MAAPYLSPAPARASLWSAPTFPRTMRSVGYERGTAVSKDWHEATSKAGVEVANEVVSRLRRLSGVADDGPDRVPEARRTSWRRLPSARFAGRSTNHCASFMSNERSRTDSHPSWRSSAPSCSSSSPRDSSIPELGSEAGRLHCGDAAGARRSGIRCLTHRCIDAAKAGQLRTAGADQRTGAADDGGPARQGEARPSFSNTGSPCEEADDVSKDAKAYPGFDDATWPTCGVRWNSSSSTSCGARSPTTANCSRPTTSFSMDGSRSFYGVPVSERRRFRPGEI